MKSFSLGSVAVDCSVVRRGAIDYAAPWSALRCDPSTVLTVGCGAIDAVILLGMMAMVTSLLSAAVVFIAG